MKIEVVIHKDNGEIRRYPVYRLELLGKDWHARYVILRNGMHESRRAIVDGEKVKIEVKEER